MLMGLLCSSGDPTNYKRRLITRWVIGRLQVVPATTSMNK